MHTDISRNPVPDTYRDDIKQLISLPDTVQKPCGTKPGLDNTRYVACSDLSPCENPASYVIRLNGDELLVCGTHRKTVQNASERIFKKCLETGGIMQGSHFEP